MKIADIIKKLTAKRERHVQDFEGLALAVHEGRELDIDHIEAVLTASGRTVADLDAAVAALQRRADRRAAIAAAAAARAEAAAVQGRIDEEESRYAKALKAHRALMADLLRARDALQRTISAGSAAEAEALREPDPVTGGRRADLGAAILAWQERRLRLHEASLAAAAEAQAIRGRARQAKYDSERLSLEAEAEQAERQAEAYRALIDEGDEADARRKGELAEIERRLAAG